MSFMKTSFVIGASLMAGVASLSAAKAADLPNRSYPTAPQQSYYSPTSAFNWGGVYAGVNAGFDVGKFTKDFNYMGTSTGGLVGGTIGYNYQSGQAVFGIEGDLDYNSFSNSGTKAVNNFGTGTGKADSLLTVRGRVGYAYDKFLPYITAGYAGGDVKGTFNDTVNRATFSQNNWQNGYTLGLGVEYAFTNNISAKIEYLYTRLNDTSYFSSPDHMKAGFSDNVIRAGINYHF